LLEEMQGITGEVIGRIFFGEVLSSYKFMGESLPKGLA